MSTLHLTTPLFEAVLLIDDETGCVQSVVRSHFNAIVGWNAELALTVLRRGFDASDLGPAVTATYHPHPRRGR